METNFKVVSADSSIGWTGRKVTGAHNGTIDIKEGSFVFRNNQLTEGKAVIDTSSIKILDIADPATNAQFAGHLASDDFFNSSHFPEAIFVIASVEPKNDVSHIKGDLTIKGITQPIAFDAKIDNNGDTFTLSGKVTVDRTKYGMKFRSGNFFLNLGDTLIYNDFDLDIQLTAKAA